jgi:hypothetical protein
MKVKNWKKLVPVKDDSLFDLLILAFFLLLTISSLGYNPAARSIPLGLGIVGAVMMFLQLLADALPATRSKLRFVTQGGLLAGQRQPPQAQAAPEAEVGTSATQALPSAPQVEVKKAVSWARVFRLILWLVAFVILLRYINYLAAVGVFLLFLTKLEARESWARSVSVAVGTCAAFYVLFEVILKAHL